MGRWRKGALCVVQSFDKIGKRAGVVVVAEEEHVAARFRGHLRRSAMLQGQSPERSYADTAGALLSVVALAGPPRKFRFLRK